MKLKLDKEDQEMLESFENGKWVRVANPEAASAVCPQHPDPLEHFPASRVKKKFLFFLENRFCLCQIELLWGLQRTKTREKYIMPRVAFFFGISIYMYMDDHGIPHCHGVYGDYAGSFSLENGERIAGEMPPKQERKIKEFISANREDLMQVWHEINQ